MEFVARRERPTRQERAACPQGVLQLLRDWERLSLQDDCLYRRVVSPADKQAIYQLLLPDLLRNDVLDKFHDETGQFGPKRSFKLIWSRFYWHGMTESVKQWCTNCKRYTVSKPPVRRAKRPFGTVSATAPK